MRRSWRIDECLYPRDVDRRRDVPPGSPADCAVQLTPPRNAVGYGQDCVEENAPAVARQRCQPNRESQAVLEALTGAETPGQIARQVDAHSSPADVSKRAILEQGPDHVCGGGRTVTIPGGHTRSRIGRNRPCTILQRRS